MITFHAIVVTLQLISATDRSSSRRGSDPSHSSFDDSDFGVYDATHEQTQLQNDIVWTLNNIQEFQNRRRYIADKWKHDIDPSAEYHEDQLLQHQLQNDIDALTAEIQYLQAQKCRKTSSPTSHHTKHPTNDRELVQHQAGTVHFYTVPDFNASKQLISELHHRCITDLIISDFWIDERMKNVLVWNDYPVTKLLATFKTFTSIDLHSANDIKHWINITIKHASSFARTLGNTVTKMFGRKVRFVSRINKGLMSTVEELTKDTPNKKVLIACFKYFGFMTAQLLHLQKLKLNHEIGERWFSELIGPSIDALRDIVFNIQNFDEFEQAQNESHCILTKLEIIYKCEPLLMWMEIHPYQNIHVVLREEHKDLPYVLREMHPRMQ